ncbi:protein arginine N-methyltransferase 9 [Patella vulgata]|uniref:protein arginine N-methyltransferase 9 n=1 Tax=Patella vulgata TaxID=6465 RepID=UPI0024A84AA1|nr:protein arginine N-methyltransferase 9 [Patella vulgata]
MAANAAFLNTSGDDKAKFIVETSLKSANTCLLNRNYGRAFAHYLLVFKLDSSFKNKLKKDFTYVMREWTEELETQNRIEDLFKCYEQACDVFPECETALNNIGAQLFRLGYIDEGAMYIRKAIRLAPDYVAARQNLENICSYLVDRWHFRMLNDITRNTAYKQAILKSVSNGVQTILDIGAGTGLLSLYAVESGARSVYACEKSKTMHEVAKDVLAKNDPEKTIKLMCKNSTDLHIPEDMPERVDVVVTETFDAGLFGENILTTLIHAHKSLIKENGVKDCIIPGRATVYICAIEAESLRNKNRLVYPVLQNVDLDGVTIVCKTTLTDSNPYTTEDLSNIRGGYIELSSPLQLLSINFNDFSEIERLNNGLDFTACLPVVKTGRLDAIVLWFDLHLDDDMTITTRPDTTNCWEQAVYPVLPQHINIKGSNSQHLDVQQGEEINIGCQLKDNHLKIICSEIKSTLKDSKILADNCQKLDTKFKRTASENNCTTLQLEHHEIANLNDITSNRVFFHAIERLRLAKNRKNLSLLDCSQGLSPLGLQAALLGYTEVCVACDEDKMEDIKHLSEINRVKVSVIDRKCIVANDDRYNVIISDLVESCGVLKQQILEEMALLRVTSLSDHGVILPNKLKIYGICVESCDLLRVSRVIGTEQTSGYHIAEFINDFQSSTHVDVDLHTLQHKKLTESFLMFDFSLNPDSSTNEPTSFLEQSAILDVNILESGSITALVYWFELVVLDDLKICTLDYTSHWKQACMMIKEEVELIEGGMIKLEVNLENSCLELKSLQINQNS